MTSIAALQQQLARERHREMIAARPEIPISLQAEVCDRWRREHAERVAHRAAERAAMDCPPKLTAQRGRPWEDIA